jgi:hypothetical protein
MIFRIFVNLLHLQSILALPSYNTLTQIKGISRQGNVTQITHKIIKPIVTKIPVADKVIKLPVNVTGKIINNIYITIYAMPDNDTGAGQFGVSTISNPVIHQIATESTGTFNSPNTFASDQLFRVFGIGAIIYIPKYRKYYILEDTCVSCTADQNNGKIHIDLFIGSNTILGGPSLLECENTLTTGGFVDTVILNPPNNLPVNTEMLYNEDTKKCNTQTFPV